MKSPIRALATTLTWSATTLLFCLGQGANPGEKKPDRAQAEAANLEGAWIEARALTKQRLFGGFLYFEWTFQGDSVARKWTVLADGDPKFWSGQKGTYTTGGTGKIKTIDIVLLTEIDPILLAELLDSKIKPPPAVKFQGIYEFDGDSLKLCVSKGDRPTAFETKGDSRLHVLKRVPKR